VPEDQREAVRARLAAVLAEGAAEHLEFSLRRADGAILRAEAVLEPGAGGDGRKAPGHIIRIRDVTDFHRTREHFAHLAATDPLTGLLSRGEFERRVEALLSHPPRTGTRTFLALVAVADPDGQQLQEVLPAVAGRIRSGLRESDLVARLGGGLLAVMLPGITTVAAAHDVMVQVVQGIAAPLTLRDALMRPSASVGLAEMFADEWLEDLFARAQTALEAARSSGRNRVQVAHTSAEQVGTVLEWRPR
jgi:diguanylate cyclase (GGDEF)-like protein